MPWTALVPAPTPELRAGLFHFFVFGSVGVASAYSAIWLSGKGITRMLPLTVLEGASSAVHSQTGVP